jgi:hypothetical protein
MSLESLNQLSAAAMGAGRVKPRRVQRGQALIEHDLRPCKLVATPRSASFGVGPTHGEVDRDDEFAIANDDKPKVGAALGKSALEVAIAITEQIRKNQK